MKIGIDIDNTLTEVQKELNIAAFNYAKKLGKDIDESEDLLEDINNNGNFYREKFKFSYDELKFFLKDIQEEIINRAKPREDAFYCIKEKQVDEKTVVEEALKVTNVGGAYLAEGMEEQEVSEVRKRYNEMPEKDYEDENGQKVVNIFTKEIKNDPNYANNYYSKICEGRKLEAQDKNKELDQIEEESEEEAI